MFFVFSCVYLAFLVFSLNCVSCSCFPCFWACSLNFVSFSSQFSVVSSILWSFRYAFCCIPCAFTCFLNFRFVSLDFATIFSIFETLPLNWLYGVGPGKKIQPLEKKFKGFTPTNPWKKNYSNTSTLEKKFKHSS